jgi:hypothetical protein
MILAIINIIIIIKAASCSVVDEDIDGRRDGDLHRGLLTMKEPRGLLVVKPKDGSATTQKAENIKHLELDEESKCTVHMLSGWVEATFCSP